MEQSDQSLGGEPTAVLARMSDVSMQDWSDDKKKDFVKTFKDRAACAQYILKATADAIRQTALSRHFISPRHVKDIEESFVSVHQEYHNGAYRVGGRPSSELLELANQRARTILAELPAARKAVQIIRPDVAKMMDRRDALEERGQKLCDELADLRGEVKLADLDQEMTISGLRKLVKDRDRRKKQIVDDLDEIGQEGTELETRISRELYAGLPGLSDAVIAVVNQHRERATALDQVQRRVEERVMFGDSKEALGILEKFESDEVEVSAQVRAEFGTALQKLQLAGKKRRGKKA